MFNLLVKNIENLVEKFDKLPNQQLRYKKVFIQEDLVNLLAIKKRYNGELEPSIIGWLIEKIHGGIDDYWLFYYMARSENIPDLVTLLDDIINILGGLFDVTQEYKWSQE